jgi:fatty acid-binding protein DegV
LIQKGNGKEIKEIIKELEEFVPQIHLYVMLEDPKWIEALGRISHLVANLMRGLAKVGIRPVLTFKNGVLVPAGVKTGAKEMPVGLLKQLEADIKKFKMENRKIRVIITHGDNFEGAQKLKEMILGKFKNAEIVFLNIINNVVGVPAGPNALTIAWCEI